MDEIFSNLFPVKKRNQRKRRENRRFGEKKRKKILFFLNGNIAFFKRTGYNGTTVV